MSMVKDTCDCCGKAVANGDLSLVVHAGFDFVCQTCRFARSLVVEVQADSSGTWAKNGLRFPATAKGRALATAYAQDLFSRWTAVREWRVVPSDAPNTGQEG